MCAGSYPWTGPHEVASSCLPVLRGQERDDGQAVDEEPYTNDADVQHFRGGSPTLDDGEVGMESNGSNEAAGSQVAIGVEEALDEAGLGADEDAASADPYVAQEEGGGLMHVGEEQVVDEDQELIRVAVLGQFDASDVVVVGRLGVLALWCEGLVFGSEFGADGRAWHVVGDHGGPRVPLYPPSEQLVRQVQEET